MHYHLPSELKWLDYLETVDKFYEQLGDFLKKLFSKIINNFYRPVIFLREDIRHILVIRMNRVGDMICTIPLLKTLRKEFQDAQITVLAEDTNADIIENSPYIDKVLVYKKNGGIYRNRIINLIRIFKGMNFDIAIGVKGGFSSNLAITTFISGAKYRVGYVSDSNHPLESLYNLPIKKTTDVRHQVEQCLNLLIPLGITPDRYIKDISMEVTDMSKSRFRDFMISNGIDPEKDRIVVFNISNDGQRWPLENFDRLIKKLRENSIICIITSTPVDFDNAKKISKRAIFYETPHIMDFAAAVKVSGLLICHDSGAMHIGASVGTKTLVLVGRGITPDVWGPYGDGHKCILKNKITDITVEEFLSEASKMLGIGDEKDI
jgi:heptosyltransferase-1